MGAEIFPFHRRPLRQHRPFRLQYLTFRTGWLMPLMQRFPSNRGNRAFTPTLQKSMAVRPALVQRAIKVLIATGRRFEQIDGRVFDLSGNVVAVDAERVKASAGH